MESQPDRRIKYVVKDVPVEVVAERVQYYGKDDRLIAESLKDYTRNTVRTEYASLDEFLTTWTAAERKEVILKQLEEQGIFLEALASEVGREFDPFDHVGLTALRLLDKNALNRYGSATTLINTEIRRTRSLAPCWTNMRIPG